MRILSTRTARSPTGCTTICLSLATNSRSLKRYSRRHSPSTRAAVDYLEKHYSDAALSLKGLAANYLFMNPDYVSRQFLQQTGYRFVDYLLALRIRKAQWLLVNGVPPQQVPERVGYSANPQYFVHLFSKATGMTPREYAQALRIEP